jgi:hypothetical protein
MRHTEAFLYCDDLLDAAENQDSPQRLCHHFPILGAWSAPSFELFLVLSDGTPTSLGLPFLAVILFRAARPRPSAESADLFVGGEGAARAGDGSGTAGVGMTGTTGWAGGGVASTPNVAEDEERATL